MSVSKEEMVAVVKAWLGAGSLNFFGMQFSGKDTQAERFADLFGGPIIGGGDILRNSQVPAHIQAALDVGDLIPKQDYIDIVLPYLAKQEFKGKPLMLSAVGRWVGEEQNVIAATRAADHPLKAVLLLDINEETAFARLDKADRGRDDDRHENLAHRLEEFRKKTLPVLDLYRQEGLLVEVDGEQTPDQVTQDILAELYHRATKEA